MRLAPEWRSVVSAPPCVASSKGDNGKRLVMVTRYPYTGCRPPLALAILTRQGWKLGGARGKKLWFEPTHWRWPPDVLESAGSNVPSKAVLAPQTRPRTEVDSRSAGDDAGSKPSHAASRGVVRLHPLPDEANFDLANVLGKIVAGATRSALDAHAKRFPRDLRGMLVGSIRKRAVNQLVCAEGEAMLRQALEARR